MTLTREFVEETLRHFFDRCETIRMAGGIPLYLVVDHKATPPKDWILDWRTDYFIPPNLFLDTSNSTPSPTTDGEQ